MLLILRGAGADADGCEHLVQNLTDAFTVATYDRRGLSRSNLSGSAENLEIETHSEDVHFLLAALTSEPAYVLGSSIGALVALDLVSRYPQQVRLLVAHEPAITDLFARG